jgi:hypothetical protein
MFNWFEPVLHLDPVSKFAETTEKPEYFVGFADNVGKILTKSVNLHRSVLRSAADFNHRDK